MHERDMMLLSQHPFILQLVATFKDRYRLFMLLEFVQGGELFSLRADQPECTFDAPTAAFYAACIVCALEYTPPEPIAQCTVPRVFCAQCTT